MAQWEKLQQLDSVYLQQLHELYDSDVFPMEVRHYLAPWIESQEWVRAARDMDLARVLFQGLLENLDIQHSRFAQTGGSFVMQHNFRRYKLAFQSYQEEPWALAGRILWFLVKEEEIQQSAELAKQVCRLQVEQQPMEIENQRNVERMMSSLRNKVQCLDYTVKCLEEQQDEFDFKYQTHTMEVTTDEALKAANMKMLQDLINRLDGCRKKMLLYLAKLLDSVGELMAVLVNKELLEWRRRQQRACIGAPDHVGLDQLEKWFTAVADSLFQVRKVLKKLEELAEKVSYDQDPVKAQRPALLNRVDSLLSALLQSAFVVETQPSMPQGKGPLVLRTNVQFSVKPRLLVKVPELNHSMKVNVSVDRNLPQTKGRRFNVLGANNKPLNVAESMTGGMVADFRHLTLKEQKCGGGGKGIADVSLSVTEELHVITFDTVFDLHGFSVDLETSSLPVVIISNSSQQQSAWASVLWFNMLCHDPKNTLFFANSTLASWPQLGDMLSWQFLSATKRGLDPNQLEMIALKLFGKQPSYDACKLSWAKFSKENSANVNFTFWAWYDNILTMVKTYLEDMWRDGSIMGFVSKAKEKCLLRRKRRGTFLLRFSESLRDGGVTFSWVDYTVTGEPDVRSVQPFTKSDLTQIPFYEILRNFQMLEAGNVPVNPLVYLYPDTPKEEAFGKYWTEPGGDISPYIKYIKTKLVFIVKEDTLEAKSPAFSDMAAGGGSEPFDGRFEESGGPGGAFPVPLEPRLSSDPDPMLPGTLAGPEDDGDDNMLPGTAAGPGEDADVLQTLQDFLERSCSFLSDFPPEEHEYADLGPHSLPGSPLTPC